MKTIQDVFRIIFIFLDKFHQNQQNFQFNAALTYTEYPLRMLNFENRAEITKNTMGMDGAGLVENDVIAKSLRMLKDPDKCLMNITTDCHPHAEFFKMSYEC